VAMLGAYIGIVTWPLISQYLLSKFGYSVAMGIMSTFSIIHLIAGVSFIDPQLESSISGIKWLKIVLKFQFKGVAKH